MPAPFVAVPPSTSFRSSGPGLVTAVVVIVAIAGLYFGREIFVPFALAVLLSFMLAPVVARLQKWSIPRVPAVIAVVLVVFSLLGGLSVLVGNQVYHLAQNLPGYQETIRSKIRSLRATTTDGGVIERALGMFQTLSREVSAPKPAAGAALPTDVAPSKEPVEVRIEQPSEPLRAIEQVLKWLAPVGTAGIVIVFVIFIL